MTEPMPNGRLLADLGEACDNRREEGNCDNRDKNNCSFDIARDVLDYFSASPMGLVFTVITDVEGRERVMSIRHMALLAIWIKNENDVGKVLAMLDVDAKRKFVGHANRSSCCRYMNLKRSKMKERALIRAMGSGAAADDISKSAFKMKSLWKFPDMVERLLKGYVLLVVCPAMGFLSVAMHDYILKYDFLKDSNCVKISLRLIGDREIVTKEKKLSMYNIEMNGTNKKKLEDNIVVALSNKIIKYDRLGLSNSKEVRDRLREKDKQEMAEKIVRWHMEFGCKCNDSTRLDRVLGMLGGGVDTTSVRSRPFLETREDDEKVPAKISDIIHLVLKERSLTNPQVATAVFKRNRKQYSFCECLDHRALKRLVASESNGRAVSETMEEEREDDKEGYSGDCSIKKLTTGKMPPPQPMPVKASSKSNQNAENAATEHDNV
ncbi:hypothetical protein O3P69_012498, partial [Scylla paramamosain]